MFELGEAREGNVNRLSWGKVDLSPGGLGAKAETERCLLVPDETPGRKLNT